VLLRYEKNPISALGTYLAAIFLISLPSLIVAIIQPLKLNSASLRLDMPVMLLFGILLIPMITWKFVLTRGRTERDFDDWIRYNMFGNSNNRISEFDIRFYLSNICKKCQKLF